MAMTPSRSKPFEAAVRAQAEEAAESWLFRNALDVAVHKTRLAHELVRFLAAALPPDPAPETLEAMYRKINLRPYDVSVESAAYRALRASLLPGEEPS